MAELHQLREWLAHPVTKELEAEFREELRGRAIAHAQSDSDTELLVSNHHFLRGQITGVRSVFDTAKAKKDRAEKEQSADEQKEGVYRG